MSFTLRKEGEFEEGKLVVLVDKSSASASEIVSGAVQDWDRGLIVGRRSFGKGLVQKPLTLRDGSQVRLTTSRYYTPTGRSIQKPYDDIEAYRREKYERLSRGELTSADSIDFPDSLKFSTKITQRDVYGGGGIMPDIFVSIDTSFNSKFYSKLRRSDVLNDFTLKYIDRNRKELRNTYPTFAAFNEKFEVDDKFLKKFLAYAKEEGIEKDNKGYNKSKDAIKANIKAKIAITLWDNSEYYEVINPLNPSFNKALEILEDGTFVKMNLAENVRD